MGLLDPKINKPRTFALLREKNATKATLVFSGGHDEGSVESITLTLDDGQEVDLPTWYCGGYTIKDRGASYEYVPMSEPSNPDEELADLLEGPINERFGSWGGVGSTYGTLVWNVGAGTVEMQYETEQPTEYRELY